MMGYFPRETACAPQAFTGERFTSAIDGQVQIEHYHRYLFARAFCQGRDVLDVASGEGYGSAHLAQVARSVVGVEYAGDTAGAAARNFPRPNLHFIQGDARRLPLADASVDVVVSFETLEHFGEQEAFLSEVRRVLRPSGLFIVSTPDRETYSPSDQPSNRYHVRELSRREFEDLLQGHFPHIAMLSQRPLLGSVVLADAGSAGKPLVFERRFERFEACAGMPRAPYLIALASAEPLPTPPHSVFIERSDIDTERFALAARNAELAEAQKKIAELTDQALDLHAKVAEAVAEATRQTEQSIRFHTALAAAEEERAKAERRGDMLLQDLTAIRRSARTFLRHYLPALRRHLFR
ncbi:MAG: class I SAM-dependent methyltransferase [Acetobacteraceae bacterium]